MTLTRSQVGTSSGGLRRSIFARSRSISDAARAYGIVAVLVLLAVVLASVSPAFLTSANLQNLVESWAAIGIIAAGMTIIFICGGFDLSAGAVFALSGIIAIQVSNSTAPHLGYAAGIGAGVAVGLFNGLLVTVGRINAFVATLSSGIVLTGVNLALTNGLLIVPTDPGFGHLGQGDLGGVRISIWILGLVFLLASLLLNMTVFGKHVFAVGGNASAAALSGVRVNFVRCICYAITGGLAGLAGVIVASRVLSAQAGAGGFDTLFTVFSAVIIGGTSFAGGQGAMWRTVAGLGVLALISNGFVLLNYSAVYQEILYGAVILLAVGLDAWAKPPDRGYA
jgi:ribose transport system permease protein